MPHPILDTLSRLLFNKHEFIFKDLNYLEAIFRSCVMVYAERCMAHKFETAASYKLVVAVAIKLIQFTGLIRNTCILRSPGGCYSYLLREHKRPVHSYLT